MAADVRRGPGTGQPGAPYGEPSGNGGNAGNGDRRYDDHEKRLRRVEEAGTRIEAHLEHAATQEDMARVETTLAHLATQADISAINVKIDNLAPRAWILGGLVAALVALTGIALGIIRLFTD